MSWKTFWQIVLLILIAGFVFGASTCATKLCFMACKGTAMMKPGMRGMGMNMNCPMSEK